MSALQLISLLLAGVSALASIGSVSAIGIWLFKFGEWKGKTDTRLDAIEREQAREIDHRAELIYR